MSPLHAASRAGDVQELERLLSSGECSVADTDRNGDTALHVAALRGQSAAVALLIAKGAQLAVANKAGYHAVHYAADCGALDALSVLLDAAPAERSARAQRDGVAPLHRAALGGRAAVVSELLARGAEADAEDAAGATPLLRACERGELAVAELLLAAGAAAGHRDTAGRTPLLAATAAAHSELALRLLAAGADACAADAAGVTPLHAAATRNLAPLAEELLRRGARADREAADGRSARECAAVGSAVRALLQAA